MKIEIPEQLVKDYITIIESPRTIDNGMYLNRQQDMLESQIYMAALEYIRKQYLVNQGKQEETNGSR